MSNALRDVLERHAHDVDDAPRDRVAQVRNRVAVARRRRRTGGVVAAAALVAALVVGVTVFTGNPRDQRPEPANPTEGFLTLSEGGGGRGINEFSAYFDVPTTDLRFVYSCPDGGGFVAIAIEGHDLVASAPCDSHRVVIDRPGPGLELEDGTRFEIGDMVELTMRRLDGDGSTETATDSDGTRMHVDILKRIDPRAPRIGELEVRPTWQESESESWELSEVRSSEPGARSFTIEVGPDVLVTAAAGYDTPFSVTTSDGGRTSSDGPVQLDPESHFDGKVVPRTGGRFTVRVDRSPEPDGVLGFALYRRIP